MRSASFKFTNKITRVSDSVSVFGNSVSVIFRGKIRIFRFFRFLRFLRENNALNKFKINLKLTYKTSKEWNHHLAYILHCQFNHWYAHSKKKEKKTVETMYLIRRYRLEKRKITLHEEKSWKQLDRWMNPQQFNRFRIHRTENKLISRNFCKKIVKSMISTLWFGIRLIFQNPLVCDHWSIITSYHS